MPLLRAGAYNVLCRLRIEGRATDIVVRCPMPTQSMFAKEKTRIEAATTMYIKHHTRIPIPEMYHHGLRPEIGPFMILQHVDHLRGLSDLPTVPEQSSDVTQILTLILTRTLLRIYTKRSRGVYSDCYDQPSLELAHSIG